MKKILTFGVFDYFHLGHLRLLKQCKMYGDYLIVAVQREEYIRKFKPEAEIMYSTDERVEMLEAIRVVDEVVPYNEVSVSTIQGIDFDVLALGEDHVGERFEKIAEWCAENKKEIVKLKRTKGISSSQIKNVIKTDIN